MLDYKLIFDDGTTAIVANATSQNSPNLIDQGALVDDRGTALNSFGPENGKLRLVVRSAVLPTAGTALYLDLMDCATEGGTYKVTGIGVASGNAIPIATLVAGYTLLDVALPPGLMRYLKIRYTTTGNHTGSAGCMFAHLEYGTMSENVTPHRV